MSQFLMVRSDDMVVLGLQWSKFQLDRDPSAPGSRPRLVATDSTAQITLTFPPQAIVEEKLRSDTFVGCRARRAGPSRVCFTVPAGTSMELNAAGVLGALNNPNVKVLPGGPTAGEPTVIEMPWRLFVSVVARSGAGVISRHSVVPIRGQESFGLWSARLQATDGSTGDAGLVLLPLRLGGDELDLDTSPLSAEHRQAIISQSLQHGGPSVRRLELSALGGSLSARAVWPTFEWDHEATIGRDQKVRVQSKGVLYPFGHRAELLEQTERIFNPLPGPLPPSHPHPPTHPPHDPPHHHLPGDPNFPDDPPDPPEPQPLPSTTATASLRSHFTLVVTEPVRGAVTDDARLARRFPFDQVEFLARSFPDLLEPDWQTISRVPHSDVDVNALLEEQQPLLADLNDIIANEPQTLQDFINQGLGSSGAAQAAQDAASSFATEAGDLAQQQSDIDHQVDVLSQGGGGGDVDPGTAEEIRQLLAQRPSNASIQQAQANANANQAEANRLSAAVRAEFNSLPRDINALANQGNKEALRVQEIDREVAAAGSVTAQTDNLFVMPQTIDKQPLRIPLRCTGANGDVFFGIPVIFVRDIEPDERFPDFNSLTDVDVANRLADAWRGHGDVTLPGIPINLVRSTPVRDGDIHEVHDLSIVGQPHAGGFCPVLSQLTIELPALRVLRPDRDARTAVEFHPDFIAAGDRSDLALKPLGNIGVDFTDRPDRSGGLMSPRFAVDAISRTFGPVASGAVPSALHAGGVPDLSTIYQGATLLGLPLASVIKVAGAGAQPAPTITPVFRAGELPGVQMVWTFALTGAPPLPLVSNPASKVTLTVENSPSHTETTCRVDNFALTLPPVGAELLRLTFDSVIFTQKPGLAPDLQINGLKIQFSGELRLLDALAGALQKLLDSQKRATVKATPAGITAGYAFGVPSVPAGVFVMRDFAMSVGIDVPFSANPVTVSLGFASRDNPFNLSVLMFGGGGYIDLQIGPTGITGLEASMEFGAMVAVDFIVASGEVHALGGVHFVTAGGGISLDAFIRIGGSVEVLGLVAVSIELLVQLHYDNQNNKLVGSAKLVIEIDISLLSESVEIDSGTWELVGSNVPTTTSPALDGLADSGLPGLREYHEAFAA